MLELQAAVIILLLLGITSIVVSTWQTGISPMPSSIQATRQMLRLIPHGFQGRILELGSGWGHVAMAAAKCFPSSSVVGYELSLLPFFFSRASLRIQARENLTFQRLDFMEVSLDTADVVICYLYPGGMSALSEKLLQELRPGSIVISNCFHLPGWQPVETIVLGDLFATRVYLYVSQE